MSKRKANEDLAPMESKDCQFQPNPKILRTRGAFNSTVTDKMFSRQNLNPQNMNFNFNMSKDNNCIGKENVFPLVPKSILSKFKKEEANLNHHSSNSKKGVKFNDTLEIFVLNPSSTQADIPKASHLIKPKPSDQYINDRLIRISQKIKWACENKRFDTLNQIYLLVSPYASTDMQARLLQFDLFSLEMSVIEKLEDILFVTANSKIN